MSRATEMRHGLDGKIGFSKFAHARAYRKYSQETLRVVKVFFLYLNPLPGLIRTYRRLLIEPGMQSLSHSLTSRRMSKSGVSSKRLRRSTGPSSATRTHSQPRRRGGNGKRPSGRWHAARLGPTLPHPLILPEWYAMLRLLRCISTF